jgi:flagellar motility protein MotE (MotC chaperone)
MLPSSKLLPITIAGIAAVLSMRAYAVATTVPSPAAFRSGAAQMLAAASATASTSVIGQAQAAEKGAAKPATGAVQPASPRRSDGPSPVSAPAPTVPGMSPAPMRPVVQEVPATNGVATSDVAKGDGATASPAAPAAAANASDLAVLGRSPAEERESQIAVREAMIAAAEKRLSERLAELVAVQQRLQGLESGLKERDEANWLGLVKLYEGMKPREAAAIFNSLEKPVLIEILDRMKPVKASPILASMDTERARQVTADLAARRTIATTN